MKRTILLTALLALLLGAAPAAASPSTVRVGVSAADPTAMASPNWERLDLKRTRYIIKWNAIDDPAAVQAAETFLRTARANDVDVLVHFSTDDYTPRAARLPSRREYREKVGALVERFYPLGVREWGVWNEANDRTQPTYRSPARAADFFVELWRLLDDRDRCGSSVTAKCRVIALDLLDGYNSRLYANARGYVRRFYARLSSTYDRRGRFVGLHNYSDTNRRRTGGTANAIRELRKRVRGDLVVWLTETGGIVRLGSSFRCDPSSRSSIRSAEARADRAVNWMLRLATRYRGVVDRLYVYTWQGTGCTTRFDAGLVRPDGSRRPAFYELQRKLRDSRILKP